MNIIDLLKGRKVKVTTDMKTEVNLEIKDITPRKNTRQITPDTPANDWWGESITTFTYLVEFTNGATKEYNNLEDIKVI